MAGGALTRYDGWFAGIISGLILMWAFAMWWRRARLSQRRAMAKSLVEVLLLNALVPVYWLIYTYFISGTRARLRHGPVLGEGDRARTTAQGAPLPGQNHLFTAALYFLKAASSM